MNFSTYTISLLFVITLLGCEATSDSVLFSSGRNGSSDIYLMNAKGEQVQQITSENSEEWSPVWVSKNEISYLRQEGDQIDLLKKNLKTGEVTMLKQPENCVLDDKNILYARTSGQQLYGCQGEVYLYDEQAQTTTSLTAELDGTANYLAWGHEEKEVVFTSNHEGNNDVYTYNLATKKLKNLTSNPANDERAEVSPDGTQLVYSSDRFEKGNQDIIVQDLPTGKVTRITDASGTELIARWSRRGNKLYYGSNKDGNWELYAYDLKTKQTTRLTNDESFDGDPRVY